MSDTAFQCLDCKQWRGPEERSSFAIQSCVRCRPPLRTTPGKTRGDDDDSGEDD